MALSASTISAAKLEPFLLLARNAKGAAAAKLIQQATSAPGCFVFSELLERPAIREIATSEEHASAFRLLELFAYGTLPDYLTSQSSYPALTDAQLQKLKLLTLVTACSASRTVQYSELLQQLVVPDVRTLEDLIIEAIYEGVVSGRLDQKMQRFEVEGCLGRDVKGKAELRVLLEQLEQWSQSADQALALFDHSMTSVRSNVARDQAHKAKQDDALAHSLTSIAEKLSQERPSGGRSGGQRGADMGMGMWGGPGMDMGMGMGSMGGARGMGAGNGFGSEDLAGLMDVDQEGYSGGPTRSKKKALMSPSGRGKRGRA